MPAKCGFFYARLKIKPIENQRVRKNLKNILPYLLRNLKVTSIFVLPNGINRAGKTKKNESSENKSSGSRN